MLFGYVVNTICAKTVTSTGNCFLLLLSSAAGPLEKPAAVKTHLRNMIIVPEMIGSQVAVYNGKVFNLVLITADMVGMYLGEFSITYRCVGVTHLLVTQ